MGGWPGTWGAPPREGRTLRREPRTTAACVPLEQVGRRFPALARTKLTLVQQLRQREARLVLQQKVQLPGGCDLRCHASTPDREGRRRLGLDLKIPMRTGNMRLQWRSQ